MTFDEALASQGSLRGAPAAEADFLRGLNTLGRHHYRACEGYRRIADTAWGGAVEADSLSDLPYLPTGLFKDIELSSTKTPTMVLHSSGTTGQAPSRITIDAETADRQARALVSTFKPILGPTRLPYLVIDAEEVIRSTGMLTARGAGVLGMMKFGARPCFSLNDDLCLNADRVRAFLNRFGHAPFLIFGFTFLVWSKLMKAFEPHDIDLSNGILVHSGGWKSLEAEGVSDEVFRLAMVSRFQLRRIHNFYGFVEQLGSIFLELQPGLLSPPAFAKVIIRNPQTLQPAPEETAGIVQVLSLLPKSYPGHNILTEDLGLLTPAPGGAGLGLKILGRLPRSEMRGCSDVIAAGLRP